nr:MAG TPA: hypothetical protein [Caudoviricetes sp.]
MQYCPAATLTILSFRGWRTPAGCEVPRRRIDYFLIS